MKFNVCIFLIFFSLHDKPAREVLVPFYMCRKSGSETTAGGQDSNGRLIPKPEPCFFLSLSDFEEQ